MCGEVLEILDDETVKVSYMVPKKISTASVELNPRLFWYWPAQLDLMNTSRAAVLPLRPVLKLAAPPSTKRFVVFKLENLDFVEKFADIQSCLIIDVNKSICYSAQLDLSLKGL